MKKSDVNIKELREYSGITQEELAQAIGKSVKTIQRYESGEGIPSTAILKKIGDILGHAFGNAEAKEITEDVLINLMLKNNAMLSVSLDVMAELLASSNSKTTVSEARSSLAKAVEHKLELLKRGSKG